MWALVIKFPLQWGEIDFINGSKKISRISEGFEEMATVAQQETQRV